MRLVLGQRHAQMLFAEDQHPVGDLGPCVEHEPFGIGVRARAPGRDLDLWVPKTCATWPDAPLTARLGACQGVG
jgi:hypothetical protein